MIFATNRISYFSGFPFSVRRISDHNDLVRVLVELMPVKLRGARRLLSRWVNDARFRCKSEAICSRLVLPAIGNCRRIRSAGRRAEPIFTRYRPRFLGHQRVIHENWTPPVEVRLLKHAFDRWMRVEKVQVRPILIGGDQSVIYRVV